MNLLHYLTIVKAIQNKKTADNSIKSVSSSRIAAQGPDSGTERP